MDQWNDHYNREKSALTYPDENLVRMMARWLRNTEGDPQVLDLGCGSGRHLKLFSDLGLTRMMGTDFSHEGLIHARRFSPFLVQCINRSLPFKESTFHSVTAWGSLHYDMKEETGKMIDEIARVIRSGGTFFATLRSDRDTMMKKGKHLGNNQWQTSLEDIAGSVVSFFSQEEVESLLSKNFYLKLGLMERCTPGRLDERISHWLIEGERKQTS